MARICITPTTPFQNELPLNLNSPISWTNRYRIKSKTWGTTYYGGRSHLVGLEWNPMAKTMQYTKYSISERTCYEPELSDFLDQSISDWVQNLGKNIIWWEESFGGFGVKSNGKNYAIQQLLHFWTNLLRTWIVRFLGPIDIGLSPKLGEQHIWWEESFGWFWVKYNG